MSDGISLSYVVWNGHGEAENFIDTINKFLEKETGKKISYSVHYLSTSGEAKLEGDCVVFGKTYSNMVKCTGALFVLPAISILISKRPKDKATRDTGREALYSIAEHYKIKKDVVAEAQVKEEEAELKTYIEYEGKTYGIVDVDIVVPKEDIEYLVKVKQLLGGGKVVIEKGETKVVIEQ